jgi:hypothetical protein
MVIARKTEEGTDCPNGGGWQQESTACTFSLSMATPSADMTVCYQIDGGMLPNTWNVDQQRKYYV